MATLRSKKGHGKLASIEHDDKQPASNFQIFSTVDDSPYVVCVPPTATNQIGYNSRKLRTHLMTAEDLACFNTEDQTCQLY